MTKVHYSEKFHAINHYIFTHNIHQLYSLCEIINIHDDRYGDVNVDYIFVPNNYSKLLICNDPPIYFENIIEYNEEDENGQKEKTGKNHRKYFTYCLSMYGKQNMKPLQDFVHQCETDYINSKKTTKQMVFEYISTCVDDDDRKDMKFHKYTFKSNKWLDRNVFFDGRQTFLENIRKFPYRKIDKKETPVITEAEKEYEYKGKTFKNAILLHGPPGTGKTSVIKGVLNETGRHGVIIQWSRIKTCAEFSSLFRSLKINGETYSLGELCYIFEDFDANKMDLLKKRKHQAGSLLLEKDKKDTFDFLSDDSDDKDEKEEKTITEKNKVVCISPPKIVEDELTLDYVLNLFDGVIELHDAMIIFTTNAKLEQFDPALIRPGRIDTIIEMKECSPTTLRDILQYHYRLSQAEIAAYEILLLALPENTIRPSMIEAICMECSDIKEAIEKIKCLCESVQTEV